MDHHCPHFCRIFGKPMEDVYTTDGKITTTSKFSTTETTISKLSTFSITSRISKLGQHLYIIQTTHTHRYLTTEERTFLQSPLSKCTKRSLLPFLGDALSWLTKTPTTKDVRDIKKRVNQLIETQAQKQDTLVHVISILNITRSAMQVSRKHINVVMEAVERTYNNVTTLLNIASSIYTCINYQWILLHIHSIVANLKDSLYYMRQIAMHAMDYIDAATTDILSLHVLPVEDLQEMLIHIKAELPSTMHLPVSSNDTLHFYRSLHTHVLVVEEQFYY